MLGRDIFKPLSFRRNKPTLEDEIERISEMYKSSDVEEAREVYNQYIELLIHYESPNSEHSHYFDMWEKSKCLSK